jgi:hypothetical protein
MDELERIVNSHTVALAEMGAKQDEFDGRLQKNEKIAESVQTLALSVGEMSIGMKYMGQNIESMKETIETKLCTKSDIDIKIHEHAAEGLKEDSNKWDKAKWVVFGIAATAILGYILDKVFAIIGK